VVVDTLRRAALIVEVKFTSRDDYSPDRRGIQDALMYLRDAMAIVEELPLPQALVAGWNSRATPGPHQFATGFNSSLSRGSHSYERVVETAGLSDRGLGLLTGFQRVASGLSPADTPD